MTVWANWYASGLGQALQNKVNSDGTIKCALLSSSYAPSLTTDIHWSDISANEVTGTGYDLGGLELTGVTVTTTAADSWAISWDGSTSYAFGAVVKPIGGNDYLYRCVDGGTSGSSPPTWPDVPGETVTDGSVTWTCIGESITIFTSDAAEWDGSTLTASFAVIYDASSGVSSTDPLLVLEMFGTSQSSSDGSFIVTPDAIYGWGCIGV